MKHPLSLAIISIFALWPVLAYAQTRDIALTVTDGDSIATIHLGLDPTATDGFDTGLGEVELPPMPPTGAFDARFVGTDIGLTLGQGTVKDFRNGDNSSVGVQTHELAYQVGKGTTITIGWSLPADVSARLQDIVTGTLINVYAGGSGSYTVTNPGTFLRLKLTVHYKPVHVGLKVFLQGPFSTGAVAMTRSLNTGGWLSSRFGAGKFPAQAVDSITVELRNAATAGSSTIRRFQPAWLLADGSVRMFRDTAVAFVEWDSLASGSYYLVVRHRNHLAVMSANAQALSATTVTYDFTTGLGQYYGGEAALLATGIYGMWAGDADGGGDIAAPDRTATWNGRNQTGYLSSDVDLSGDVAAPDRTLTWNNRNKVSRVL